MQILEIRDAARWREMERDWYDLMAQSGTSNVYLSPAFVRTWWTHLGALEGGFTQRPGGLGRSSAAEELLVLAGEDDGRLVGLAPFQVLRVELDGCAAPVRILSLVGDVLLTRYRDVLALPGREREFLEAVWSRLCGDGAPTWDAAFLGNLHEESETPLLSAAALRLHAPPGTRYTQFRSKVVGGPSPENVEEVRAELRQAAESRRLPEAARAVLLSLVERLAPLEGASPEAGDRDAVAREAFETLEELGRAHPEVREVLGSRADRLGHRLVDMEYPFIPLPGTWEEYKATLSRRSRSTLRGDANRLARAGSLVWETLGEDYDPDRDFEDLVRLHHCVQGDGSLTLNAQTLGFQREALAEAARRGWLRLSFCRLDGRRVAGLACYDCGGRRYAALIGRDTSAPSSPGMLILARAVEEGIALGLRELDFGTGSLRYKRHFTTLTRRVNNLLVKKPSLPLSLQELVLRLHGIRGAVSTGVSGRAA